VDLAARLLDLAVVLREIVDRDVEDLVARPRSFMVRLEDAAVDAHLVAGLDDPVVELRPVPHLPAENLRVERRYACRILRHHFEVDDGEAHASFLSLVKSLRSSAALRIAATAANSVATMNAARKPEASASVASTARPSAPPIMKAVLTTPEARPDSLGATSLIATSRMGLSAMPQPTPSNTMQGSTCRRKVPPGGAAANSASPTAARPSPTASGRRLPKRITILAERPSENAAMIRFDGRKARPICIGVYSMSFCR